jgi:exodeoxyribonuclease V alpha subunit
VRIYKTYRDEAIEVVRREPYRLAAEVWGIGFKTADQIAQRLGIPHDSPQRVKAGLQFALSEASEDGHCYLPEAELVTNATGLLGVDTALAGRCLEELVAEEGVIAEPLPAAVSPDAAASTGRAIWLVPFHRAEVALAGGLLRLLDAPADRLSGFQAVDWPAALDWLGRTIGVTLAPEQEAAVRLALTQRLAVLTGGPGCGKSYTVRAVVALARAKRAKVVLAAPTGRAAKRLSELAGLEAATLHRLLQLRPGGDAAFDRDHPLDADLLVVDEVSMLDVLLANKLVKAIPPGAHLLFVGDVDQLPSVGAGEVLRDLLAAERLPRVRLTRVFRQAQHSGVVANAHRINAGRHPITHGLADFFLFPEEDSEQVADMVVDIVANRLPRRFGLDPGGRCRCCVRCIGGRPARASSTSGSRPRSPRGARGWLSAASAAGCTGLGTRSCRSGTTMTRAPPGCSTGRSGRSRHSRWRTASCGCCWMRMRRWPTGLTSWTS